VLRRQCLYPGPMINPWEDRADHVLQSAKGHYSSQYSHACEIHFDSDNSLQHHLRSSIHLGSNIECRHCDDSFVTTSGLLHHFENGSCRNCKANHRTMARDLCDRDTDGLITIQKSIHGDVRRCRYTACRGREFGSVDAVLLHLMSDKHSMKVYRCPTGNIDSSICKKLFVSRAGLSTILRVALAALWTLRISRRLSRSGSTRAERSLARRPKLDGLRCLLSITCPIAAAVSKLQQPIFC